MLFATFISSFVQLGIALLIPAIWWAVTTKRRLEFATWIGLYVPTWKVGPVQRVSQKQLGIGVLGRCIAGISSDCKFGMGCSGDLAIYGCWTSGSCPHSSLCLYSDRLG